MQVKARINRNGHKNAKKRERDMTDARMNESARASAVWGLLIQLSGIALLVLLVVAYATGEEYPHTHAMIGYAIAILILADLFWFALAPRNRNLPAPYTPDSIKLHFGNAGGLAKTLASLIAVLAALPLSALIVMLITHGLWGATAIDEMHEVVAYFALGLVVVHVVMVGIASAGLVEGHLRNMFGRSQHH
jgi:FtsH-binding integral membrane protein